MELTEADVVSARGSVPFLQVLCSGIHGKYGFQFEPKQLSQPKRTIFHSLAILRTLIPSVDENVAELGLVLKSSCN